MNPSSRTTLIFAAILASAGVTGSALALDQGTTRQSRPYVSGGVSIEEVEMLESHRNDYQLWLVTADLVSGAWLAGARVSIRDAKDQPVLDTQLDGPYLFVNLLPGRYSLDVTQHGATQHSTVLISGRGLQQVMTRFKTGAEVSPEMPDHSPAKVSPAEPGSVNAIK
ncbi:MAG: carboxypeptidase-like regulatory domain-containing protein [Burkholderiaceae bacterium]|jgi:hypothetical protein|nr:carboxypeptidase-like regulatory domain-containing protein [Burkholderiaceae bacterium]